MIQRTFMENSLEGTITSDDIEEKEESYPESSVARLKVHLRWKPTIKGTIVEAAEYLTNYKIYYIDLENGCRVCTPLSWWNLDK